MEQASRMIPRVNGV